MARSNSRRAWTRRGFTQDQVSQAALTLLDEHGVEGLTIRALGQALGVAPNAVYTYVESRRDLERLTVERVLADVVDSGSDRAGLPDPAPAAHANPAVAAVAAVRSLALRTYAALRRHRGAARLLMSAPMDGPVARGLHETLLGYLIVAGLAVDEAARTAYVLMTYVIGTVALGEAELESGATTPPDDVWVQSRADAMEIDPAIWPLTAASCDVMARWVTTEQFEWGLARLLEGAMPDPVP